MVYEKRNYEKYNRYKNYNKTPKKNKYKENLTTRILTSCVFISFIMLMSLIPKEFAYSINSIFESLISRSIVDIYSNEYNDKDFKIFGNTKSSVQTIFGQQTNSISDDNGSVNLNPDDNTIDSDVLEQINNQEDFYGEEEKK